MLKRFGTAGFATLMHVKRPGFPPERRELPHRDARIQYRQRGRRLHQANQRARPGRFPVRQVHAIHEQHA